MQGRDSNLVASFANGIFNDACCTSNDSSLLDDCSLNFEELPSFSKLTHKNSSLFDSPKVDEYLFNADNHIVDYMTTTPRQRKWQPDDEIYNIPSSHLLLSTSPIKTPPLPPKKAFKLRVSTPPRTDDKEQGIQAARVDPQWVVDPLLSMPLSEIPTGFDKIKCPDKIQSETKVRNTSETSDICSSTKTPKSNKPLAHPGAPKLTTRYSLPISNREIGCPSSVPEIQISRPSPMIQQAASYQNKVDPSLQRILFPSLDACFGGQQPMLAAKNSGFHLQMTPVKSNHSNHPGSPNPNDPMPPPPMTTLERRSSAEELERAFLEATFNAFTPIAAPKVTGPPATVTPEPGKKAPPTSKKSASKPVKVARKSKVDNKKKQSKKSARKPAPKASPTSRVVTPEKKKLAKSTVSAHNDKWMRQYENAKAFALVNGHCIIPNVYPIDPSLGGWAKRQRYQYKIFKKQDSTRSKTSRTCSINNERIELLNRIGFCWDTRDFHWQKRFNELAEFIHEHGHAGVPTIYKKNQYLAGWVKVQRRQYRLFLAKEPSAISQDRINRLNKVGFVWSIKDCECPSSSTKMEQAKGNKNNMPSDAMLLDTAKILSVNLD